MKTAMVVMVVLLAAILSPLTGSAQSVRMGGRAIEGPGYVISPNGGPSVVMRRPNGSIDTSGSGGYRTSNRGGYDNRMSSDRYNNDYDDDYGYQNNSRNRSGINIGLGTRLGRVRINVGFHKTTYSRPKPKPRPRPQIVVAQKPSSEKCRLTLVREVGDDLETISPIVVTNPEKELVRGKSIVFERDGEFFAEYSVLRVVGDTVFVKVVDAPHGNPRQGDSFSIEDSNTNTNTVSE